MAEANHPLLAIQVECYAGYRGEETPRRFHIGRRSIEITTVIDRWLAPEHRYFKVRGDDGSLYILRHDTLAQRWELTMYEKESGDGPAGATSSGFDGGSGYVQ